MAEAFAYDWPNKKRYPIWYEDRGDRLLLKWAGMPSHFWHYVKEEVKGCEGTKWHPDSKSWTTVHPTHSLRTKNVLGYLTNETIPNTSKAWRDRYKLHPTQAIHEFIESIPVDFRPYQADDLALLLARKRMVLGYEMGLGKTLMAMSVIHFAHSHLQFSPNSNMSQDPRDLHWMVGPLTAIDTWKSELIKWNFNTTPSLISNSVQGIRRAMNDAPHPPITLTIDESAYFKSDKAQRTAYMRELSRLMDYVWNGTDYILCMTGTTAPNDPTDWHSPVEILCPGFIRERSPIQLRSRLAYTSQEQNQSGQSYTKVLGWDTKEVAKFSDRLEPIRIIRYKKDVESDLPDKIYIERICDTDPALLATARMLIKTLPAVQWRQAIRQLSDGFQYEKDYVLDANGYAKLKRTGTSYVDCPKDELLKRDCEEIEINGETRLVVWGALQGTIDRIVKLLHEREWDVIQLDGRKKVYLPIDANDQPEIYSWTDYFQEQRLDRKLAIVGNPDSSSESLNLHKAKTMIFYSNGEKSNKRLQAEERIHRLDMDKNIAPRIIDYLNLPTDRLILNNLRKKKDLERLAAGEALSVIEAAQLEMSK